MTKAKKPKPANAWFVWDDCDEDGNDIVHVESIPVAWDNGTKLKLSRPAMFSFGIIFDTKCISRTREQAIERFIARCEREIKTFKNRIAQEEQQIKGAKMLQEKTDAKRSPPVPRS